MILVSENNDVIHVRRGAVLGVSRCTCYLLLFLPNFANTAVFLVKNYIRSKLNLFIVLFRCNHSPRFTYTVLWFYNNQCKRASNKMFKKMFCLGSALIAKIICFNLFVRLTSSFMINVYCLFVY